MNIQQYIFNNTGVILPTFGGNGQSQDQAVVIASEVKYRLIQVENDFHLSKSGSLIKRKKATRL